MIQQSKQKIRGLYAAQFASAFPGIKLIVDNEAFDWDKRPDLFVESNVEFQASRQIGMSASPRARRAGHIYFRVHCRYGSGDSKVTEIIDWLIETLEFQQVDRVCIEEGIPDGDTEASGWYFSDLKFPFYVNP